MRRILLVGLFWGVACSAPAPTLTYSTYLGGEGDDFGYGIAVDGGGNAYLVGETFSSEAAFPVTNAFKPLNPVRSDAFVTKISASGTLVFSTFFGGDTNDGARAVAIDSASNIYLAGYTTSDTGFPITNAFQSVFGPPGTNGFVAKLSPAGTSLVYASFFGGSGADAVLALAVDASGAAYLAGATDSTNLPMVQALQATPGGSQDGFVAKVHPAGTSLVFSTYLGGDALDAGNDLVLDAGSNVYVVGETRSTNYPVVQALAPNLLSASDGFLTKLIPSGTARVFSTYLGGTGDDVLTAVAVDSASNVYVGGYGQSFDLPVTNPIQSSFQGYTYDMYVGELTPSGTQLVFLTYLGGENSDYLYDLAVDEARNVQVVGFSASSNFPTRGALQPARRGYSDVLLAKLAPGGRPLVYSTFLGGDAGESVDAEFGRGLAVQKGGIVHVIGYTTATNFPLLNPIHGDTNYADALYFRISDEPLVTSLSPGLSNTVQWMTYSGLAYKLQSSTGLLPQAWNDLMLPVAATGGLLSAVDSPALCCPVYRVAQVQPLACAFGFAGCGSYQDQTAPASNRIIKFVLSSYTPQCLRIKAGQTVSFQGQSGQDITGFHPLRWTCQEGAVATNAFSGTNGVFTFNTPGNYNYYCSNHGNSGGSGMAGSIQVVP